MENILRFQAQLAKEYNYKPLPADKSRVYRELYHRTIPSFLKLEGEKDQQLYTLSGTLICDGYERIVIGDYGAFIELTQEQAKQETYIVKPGQEYRLLKQYHSTAKYEWFTTRDCSDVKIYHQIHPVLYADYKPGFFYVSVFEVRKKVL